MYLQSVVVAVQQFAVVAVEVHAAAQTVAEHLAVGACADCKMFRYCLGGGMHLHGDDGELLYCHYHRL